MLKSSLARREAHDYHSYDHPNDEPSTKRHSRLPAPLRNNGPAFGHGLARPICRRIRGRNSSDWTQAGLIPSPWTPGHLYAHGHFVLLFLMGIVNKDGGSILKSDSVAGIVPVRAYCGSLISMAPQNSASLDSVALTRPATSSKTR